MTSEGRAPIGPMSGALFALALLAFAMGALDGAFRPLVVASTLAGALVAVLLWRRNRRGRPPTISQGDAEAERGEPDEPR